MNKMNVSLVAFASLLAMVGCTVKNDGSDDEESLGSAESQLMKDDDEANAADEDLEQGLDEPLSGATPLDPGAPADGADLMEKVRKNPGLFFQPAGCITTTIAGNVATHVFAGCTGPHGMVSFNGTVTSTYAPEAGKLTVTHAASDFKINGATISGSRVVVYTRAAGVITKDRTGSWSGQTAKGAAISHEAHFVTSYDSNTRCITRDGSAETSVGGRSFSRSIEGFKRCGIGRLGCPDGGKVVLSASGPNRSGSLSIEFLGGRHYTVILPSGRELNRLLVCNPNAS